MAGADDGQVGAELGLDPAAIGPLLAVADSRLRELLPRTAAPIVAHSYVTVVLTQESSTRSASAT